MIATNRINDQEDVKAKSLPDKKYSPLVSVNLVVSLAHIVIMLCNKPQNKFNFAVFEQKKKAASKWEFSYIL